MTNDEDNAADGLFQQSAKMPLRTCLACRKVREKRSLIRLAAPEGVLTADVFGVLPGRGAYLCPDEGCIKEAYKKKERFARALKQGVAPLAKTSFPPLEEFMAQVLKHSPGVQPLTIGK